MAVNRPKRSRLKRNLLLLVLLFVSYVAYRSWPHVYYREPLRDLREMGLVLEPREQDQVWAELKPMLSPLARQSAPSFAEVDDKAARAFLSDNAEVIQAFMDWYGNGGKEKMAAYEGMGPHSRIPLNHLSDDVLRGMHGKRLVILGQALIHHCRYSLLEDQAIQANEGFEAVFAIIDFLLQNPDDFAFGCALGLCEEAVLVLGSYAPVNRIDADMFSKMPDEAVFRDAFRKAVWFQLAEGVSFFENMSPWSKEVDYQAYLRNKLLPIYHKTHSMNMLYDDYEALGAELSKPFPEMDFSALQAERDVLPSRFNPVGRWMRTMGAKVDFLEVQTCKAARVLAMMDVLRAKYLLINEVGSWDVARLEEMLDGPEFQSPYPNRPYGVGEDGAITVGDGVPPGCWLDRDTDGQAFYAIQVFDGLDRLPGFEPPKQDRLADQIVFNDIQPRVSVGTVLRFDTVPNPPLPLPNFYIEEGPVNASINQEGVLSWLPEPGTSGLIPIKISVVGEDEVLYHTFLVEVVAAAGGEGAK